MEDMNATPASQPTEDTNTGVENAQVEDTALPADTSTDGIDQQTTDEAPAAESSEDENDYVTDENGNKFIPAEKMQAIVAKRLAAMADQKNNAVAQFRESLRNDPEAKRQFLEELGIQNPAGSEDKPETPSSSAYDGWLAQNVQPEYHAHYKQMADAQWATVMPHIQQLIDKAVNPLVGYIGKQTVSSFKAAHPDYVKYEGKMQDFVRTGRAKTMEDAYILASHEDKLKGVGSAAVRQENERRSKLANNPSPRKLGAPGRSTPKATFGPNGLRGSDIEAIAKNMGLK